MQKKFNHVLLLAVMLAFGYGAKAQTPTDTMRLSLSEAIDLGIKNNLTLQNSSLDYRKAKKKVWETTAIGLPQASISGTYTHALTVPELSFGKVLMPDKLPDLQPLTKADIKNAYVDAPAVAFGSKNTTAVDLTASQLIFNGEWLVGLQAAKAYERLQDKLVLKSTNQTKESITSAYNSVLIIQEAYNNLNSSLTSISKLYNEVKAYNAQGLNDETDVDQLKISVNNLQAATETLKGQIVTIKMLLQIQLGMDFNQPIVLTSNLDELVQLAPLQTMVTDSFNIASSVDYQLAQSQEQLMKLSLKREYAKFLPSVGGFYLYHKRLGSEGLDFQSENTFGIKITLPILTGGSRIFTVGQAKLEYLKAQNSSRLAEQGLQVEFTAARNGYLSSYSSYINMKESMELSLKVYNKNLIKYQEGMLSSSELTISQNQYLTSQKSYFDSELNLLNAKAKLERILTKSE